VWFNFVLNAPGVVVFVIVVAVVMFNDLTKTSGEDPNCTKIKKYVAMVPII